MTRVVRTNTGLTSSSNAGLPVGHAPRGRRSASAAGRATTAPFRRLAIVGPTPPITRLTADEIATFAEIFGHELTMAQMTHLEEWVTAHRAEAVVMHEFGGDGGGHTRVHDPEIGPPFCDECSRAVQDWVPWPCSLARDIEETA
jgi:hypothetical protein